MARRLGLGVVCAALLFVCGVLSAFAGTLTCHEDLQSASQAPNLCATAGNGIALSVSAMAGPGLVLLLVLGAARRRTIGYTTAAFLLAQAALFTMWALVSHGTIRY
jgi:hypothetical protein